MPFEPPLRPTRGAPGGFDRGGRGGSRRMTASAERASADNGRPDVPEAALVAARAADAKLGQNTVVLAMGDLLGVTDAFVITSGANTRQVRTIVDEVERQVKESDGALAAGDRGPARPDLGPHGLRRLPGPRLPGRGARLLRPRTPVGQRPSSLGQRGARPSRPPRTDRRPVAPRRARSR